MIYLGPRRKLGFPFAARSAAGALAPRLLPLPLIFQSRNRSERSSLFDGEVAWGGVTERSEGAATQDARQAKRVRTDRQAAPS